MVAHVSLTVTSVGGTSWTMVRGMGVNFFCSRGGKYISRSQSLPPPPLHRRLTRIVFIFIIRFRYIGWIDIAQVVNERFLQLFGECMRSPHEQLVQRSCSCILEIVNKVTGKKKKKSKGYLCVTSSSHGSLCYDILWGVRSRSRVANCRGGGGVLWKTGGGGGETDLPRIRLLYPGWDQTCLSKAYRR